MFVFGIVGMAVLCCLRAKQYRLTCSKAIVFTLLLSVVGLLGTKLLFIAENIEIVMSEGLSLAGQSFFGALFLIPPIVALYSRLFGLRAAQGVDLCAAPVIFILMCMRMGCLMSGCCGGIFIGTFQVPAQFLEALGDAIILTVLLETEKRNKFIGRLYPLLMVLYGSMRFFLEFVRDTEKNLLGFSQGQLYSVIAIVVGVAWLKMKGRKQHEIRK